MGEGEHLLLIMPKLSYCTSTCLELRTQGLEGFHPAIFFGDLAWWMAYSQPHLPWIFHCPGNIIQPGKNSGWKGPSGCLIMFNILLRKDKLHVASVCPGPYAWNTSRDGHSIALGNMFPCLTRGSNHMDWSTTWTNHANKSPKDFLWEDDTLKNKS